MLWRPINDQFNLAKFALKKYFQGEEHAIKLAESKLHGITAHSARVTLLDCGGACWSLDGRDRFAGKLEESRSARFEVRTESHEFASSDGPTAREGHGRPLPPVRGAT